MYAITAILTIVGFFIGFTIGATIKKVKTGKGYFRVIPLDCPYAGITAPLMKLY